MSNGCPICAGVGRVLAFGACRDPIPVPCPECAGLSITPASADDVEWRAYPAAEITAFLLGRWPALPAGPVASAELVEAVDELPEASVRGPVEA